MHGSSSSSVETDIGSRGPAPANRWAGLRWSIANQRFAETAPRFVEGNSARQPRFSRDPLLRLS